MQQNAERFYDLSERFGIEGKQIQVENLRTHTWNLEL